MADLDAATLADVRSFFSTYYTPGNAALAIAGAVHAHDAFELVEQHFGAIPAAPPPPRTSAAEHSLASDVLLSLEDDVHLPRLYMAWHAPRIFAPGDAELDIAARVLGSGKTARLYQRLVHDLEIAQDVEAEQESGLLGSTFGLSVTAREGVPLSRIADEVHAILRQCSVDLSQRELDRARNHIETSTIDSIQGVGGFGGKADRLNHYFYYANDADYLAEDLRRYEQLTVAAVREQLKTTVDAHSVILSVVPRDKAQLAVA
jgi:zinc protease